MTLHARHGLGPAAALALSWLLTAGCDNDKGRVEQADAQAVPAGDAGPSLSDAGAGTTVTQPDGAVMRDGSTPLAGSDSGAPETGGGGADAGGSQATGGGTDAGLGSDSGAPGASDPLAPFALDCAHLPAGGACQGGPREVLLVTEQSGLMLMFDPGDGHFLGYFKRPAASYQSNKADYWLATQAPDQCIWSVSEDNGIERWKTDGSALDKPLHPQYAPVPGEPDELVVQSPRGLAFSANQAYVAAQYGTPHPRLTRWNLDGSFDKIVLEDETEAQSLLVLGDGSLLISDDNLNRVVRIPAGGGVASPVLGGLDWPAQISYSGAGKLLVSNITLGSAAYEVEIASGMARTIFPMAESSSNKYGIAPLHNGHWLITGGQFLVASLDPSSMNPSGQNKNVWNDAAADSVNFRYVGRACLPTAVVDSRASKPANDTCIEPPDGPVLFQQDFESGIAPFVAGAGSTVSIVNGGAPLTPDNSVQILGTAPAGSQDAVVPDLALSLNKLHPSYVRYFVKVNSVERAGSGGSIDLGSFLLRSSSDDGDALAGTYFSDGYLSALNAGLGRPYSGDYPQVAVNTWLRIELRNIDWTTRTYDLYVDCKRKAEGVSLPLGVGDDISVLWLKNYDAGDATRGSSFDDILIK